jgi:hypothetical protein
MAKKTDKQEKKKGPIVIDIEKTIDDRVQHFIFDSEKMMFLQNEEIEKLLSKIGYHDMMAEFFSEGAGASIMNKAAEKAEAEAEAVSENAAEVSAAPKATKDDIKTGLKVGVVLAKLNAKLIASGSRATLVTHLLVPEGREYSSETVKIIHDKVLPRLTTEEVERVIGGFFTFDKLLRSGFPTYLIG